MGERAIIYARVSQDSQRDNNSIPSQVEACVKYAANCRYQLMGNRFVDPSTGRDVSTGEGGIPAYVDDFSSLEINRPSLDAAFQYLEKIGFDVVIVHANDRMARDPFMRRTLEIDFMNRGARVEYVLNQYEDTPEGEVKKDLDSTFAKWENAKRVERCNRGKMHKASVKKMFVSGRAPYGYQIDTNAPGGLAIIEEQAQAVSLIFRWYVYEGLSIYQIQDRLNKSDFTPSDGGQWGKSSIYHILKNTAYIGYVFYNKNKRVRKHNMSKSELELRDESDWLRIEVTSLIDKSLFDRAQERMDYNRRIIRNRNDRSYLLSGMVTCSQCKKAYSAYTYIGNKPKRPNDTVYYRHRIRMGHCLNRTISGNNLEGKVWRAITNLLLDPEKLYKGYQGAIEQENKDRQRNLILMEEYQRKVGKIEQELQNLLAAYTDPDIELSKKDYIARRDTLKSGKKSIQAELEEIQSELSSLPTPEEYSTLELFAGELQSRLQAPEWEPTFENMRWVLEKLHCRVTIAEDGKINVSGWFGEIRDISSITSRHYAHPRLLLLVLV